MVKNYKLPCTFNIDVIPLYVLIYCNEYNLVKIDSNSVYLNITEMFYSSSINFTVRNYIISENIDYNIYIKAQKNNSYDFLKKENIVFNANGFTFKLQKELNEIKRLSIILLLYFSDNLKINIMIDCILIPFKFELLCYDYEKKKYVQDSITIHIGKGDIFKCISGKMDNNEDFNNYNLCHSISLEFITLYFKVLMPDTKTIKNKINFIPQENSKYIEILNQKIDNSINSSFNFQFDLRIKKENYYEKDNYYCLHENKYFFTLIINNKKKEFIINLEIESFANYKECSLKYNLNFVNNKSCKQILGEPIISQFGLLGGFSIDYDLKNKNKIKINENVKFLRLKKKVFCLSVLLFK